MCETSLHSGTVGTPTATVHAVCAGKFPNFTKDETAFESLRSRLGL